MRYLKMPYICTIDAVPPDCSYVRYTLKFVTSTLSPRLCFKKHFVVHKGSSAPPVSRIWPQRLAAKRRWELMAVIFSAACGQFHGSRTWRVSGWWYLDWSIITMYLGRYDRYSDASVIRPFGAVVLRGKFEKKTVTAMLNRGVYNFIIFIISWPTR